MIRIKLIPDGLSTVPSEAVDHGVLASEIQAYVEPLDLSGVPIDSWRDVERYVPPHERWIELRVPGSLSDYPQQALDNFAAAITTNIAGTKKHRDGWVDVPEEA